MSDKKWGTSTICTHVGEVKDEQFKGMVSPIFMTTTYAFDGVDKMRYPRYFNTPNQEQLSKKIAALEHGEAALIFSSGMAALSTMLLAFLKKGDHVVFQNILYGGSVSFIREELPKFGIEYTFTKGSDISDFEAAIQPNTKVIHIETPSNPLLTITDLRGVVALAKSKRILTTIDNTFASPINQNPLDFGIDVVMHSATKYLGGHSDILAGVVISSNENMEKIWHVAKNMGGTLSDFMVWLLERSMKTLSIRVKAQNRNAKKIAKHLEKHPDIKRVHYPGLKSHSHYELAKSQMHGFGGMMSFELNEGLDALQFQNELKLIKPAMSLAGVESTMVSPFLTSHASLKKEERERLGISDRLIRFSVGIESRQDLIEDIEQAISKVKSKRLTT